MKLTAVVEAKKGQTKRFEKHQINDKEMELLADKKPKWLNNYGYIVGTYQEDGDEVDCFILGKALNIGKAVEVQPVAMIVFDDDAKVDDKLICIQKSYNKILLGLRLHRLLKCIKKTKPNSKVLAIVKDKQLIQAKIDRAQSLYRVLIGGVNDKKD